MMIGATSESAQQMDHGQALDGEGPCLHALSSGAVVSVTDYASDSRGPAPLFGPQTLLLEAPGACDDATVFAVRTSTT